MSLVSSHHIKLNNDNSKTDLLTQELIQEITQYIILHQGPLIVDVKSGQVDQELLEKEILSYLDKHHHFSFNRHNIVTQVMDFMFGYGILQPLIEDDDITDIDVCRYNYIMYKKNGQKFISEIVFQNEASLAAYCKLIVIRLGGVLNESDAHARVADLNYRLRINVTIEPRNTSGASMTIRKHRMNSYDLNDLVHAKMMDKKVYELIRQLIKTSARILIVGKGAAGKTTLLRAILNELPYTERFLVCESESELYLSHGNFIVQKVDKKQKSEALNTLIKDGLTMSLDGYCIGELIGEEIYEFLKAGYTDHRIIGTLHAQSVESTFPRIQMMLKHYQKSLELEVIAGALDIIIYMKKFKIVSITEVGSEGHQIKLNPLIQFNIHREFPTSLEGQWEAKNDLTYQLKQEIQRRF
ncbi:MAG: CpaF family protein [Clostridia bacterium]|nr:CpaF family protein [Clostridia bacterium]